MYKIEQTCSTLNAAVDTDRVLVLKKVGETEGGHKIRSLRDFKVELNDSYIVRVEIDTRNKVTAAKCSENGLVRIVVDGFGSVYELGLVKCLTIEYINVHPSEGVCFVWVGYTKKT